jgi:hypothetical protein
MNRVVLAVILLVAGIVGLFMAACGGFFTFFPLFNPSNSAARGLWAASIPSLLAGAFLLRWAWRRFTRFRREAAASAHATEPPDARS